MPLPRASKGATPIELSYENCPPNFISFLRIWANNVPSIQALSPEERHDLARLICGLEPLQSGSSPVISGIAADLRAVAIEISQRRSFQDRYAADLQAALDAGGAPGAGSPRKASFVPPPVYDPSPSPSPPGTPAQSYFESSTPGRTQSVRPQSPAFLSPYPAQSIASISTPSVNVSSNPPSPTFLTPDSPAIEFIRETLYASLADVLERQPSLRRLLKRDPPRAYFASVAFAILEVACTSMTPDGAVIGVLGKPLTLADCPRPLQPFMAELATIGKLAKNMEEEDTQIAIQLAQDGKEVPLSRLDRVRSILTEGVGNEGEISAARQGRRSVEGRAVAFANRVNALSLGMTKIKAFRERQEGVFKVLAGIGS